MSIRRDVNTPIFELYAIGAQPQAGPRHECRRRDVVGINDTDCDEINTSLATGLPAQMLLHSLIRMV